MNLSVGVKNGFLGNRAGLDVTDWVLPRARAVGATIYLKKNGRVSRGYMIGRRRKRRFRTWLEQRAQHDRIILVGKSIGAHEILTAVDQVGCWESCDVLLFDPACSLQRGEKHVRPLSWGSRVTVVRQEGYRSGYRVEGALDHVVPARHSNIERTHQAQHIGETWLSERGLPAC